MLDKPIVKKEEVKDVKEDEEPNEMDAMLHILINNEEDFDSNVRKDCWETYNIRSCLGKIQYP